MSTIARIAVLVILAAGCGDNLAGDPGPDATTSIDSIAALTGLAVEGRLLEPAFDPEVTEYRVDARYFAVDAIATATADAGAAISINGAPVDSGVPSDPIALELGDNTIAVDVAVGSSARTYTITVVRGQAVLDSVAASNREAGDQLGFSVAIDGDTLAVGAFREDSAATGINGDQADNSANEAGAVYVFTRSDSGWRQQAYVKASNTGAGDHFGFSVALDGDTLAVGALSEASAATGVGGDQADNSAPGAGAVYLFTRTNAVWSQQAYLKASNTDAGDQFGLRVALSGETLAVSAGNEDSAATEVDGDEADNSAQSAGAVYIFGRIGLAWQQQAYLKTSNTGAGDFLGLGLALDGDTLAVGAYLESSAATGVDGDQADDSAPSAGAVYVFTRANAIWSQQAYLKASNTGAFDMFGSSVALSGDTLAVSSLQEDSAATGIGGDQSDNAASNAGAVYVFGRTGATWSQQAYLKASNTDANDRFGRGVALCGDLLAVGAVGEASGAVGIDGDQADNSAFNAGAVYVFSRAGATWSQLAYAKARVSAGDARLGFGVAVDRETIVAGAHLEDTAAGAVHVFE